MLTVFVATFNRTETLERSIASYRRFAAPYRVVVIDNGTDHPAALATLERVARLPEVAKIYNLPKVQTMDELTAHYNVAVRDVYRRGLRQRGRWFAITDADVCFDGCPPETIDAYIALAERGEWAVGPHLRIEQFPAGYPMRSRVLAAESRLLYRDTMEWFYPNKPSHKPAIPYSPWQIDTTFHLFPATREFRRLEMGTVRVGPPYTAQHLDWYVDIFNPSEGDLIYLAEDGSGREVGSWGRSWLRSFCHAYWRLGPEQTLRWMLTRPRQDGDLCNTSFLLAWLFQYGLPEPDLVESRRWLDCAVPRGSVWWPNRADWLRLVYDDDFSVLGWA